MEKEPKITIVYDWRKKSNKCTPAYVYVRVYYNRTRREYVSTGVKVLPDEWSDTFWVVRRDDADTLNTQIKEQYEMCVKMIGDTLKKACADDKTDELPNASQMIIERGDAPFLDWLKDKIMSTPMAPKTRTQHMVMYRSIAGFGKVKMWKDISYDNLSNWIDGLGMRGLSQPTVYGYWKRIRKYLRIAVSSKKISEDSFKDVKVKRGKHKPRVFLTDDEMQSIIDVDLRENNHLEKARDLFVVQMGTGVAYKDLMSIDFRHHTKIGKYETLSGSREKNEENYFIVILPFAAKVLKKYKWQLEKISNQKYNDYVDTVVNIAGVTKHVTSHIARHTYACYCLRHGIRLESVQRTLGHSDIRTTQIYARLQDMDVMDSFKKLK